MIAYIITLTDNIQSVKSSEFCIASIYNTNSELNFEIFPAIDHNTVDNNINWKWPSKKSQICPDTLLVKKAYKTKDIRKRIACAESHYRLWQIIADEKEPAMILEHDALFTRTFYEFEFEAGVLSINDPRGATFESKKYHNSLDEGENEVPWLTDTLIPQGLPGNSAYIVQPWAAKKLVELQDTIGWWPNDAIMCKQLCPWISAYKPYFTKTQNTVSTTTH